MLFTHYLGQEENWVQMINGIITGMAFSYSGSFTQTQLIIARQIAKQCLAYDVR